MLFFLQTFRDYLKLSGGVQFKQKEKLQHSASQEPCNECTERVATCMCIKCDAKMCSLCFDKVIMGLIKYRFD